MGGQDGYQRTILSQSTESTTALAGFKIDASKSFDLGLNVTWTVAEQGLDPFDLSAPDYVATHPPMSYDFSQSHTYSMIDVTRLDATAFVEYVFDKDMWLNVYYRYADFDDDMTMFDDQSGKLNLLGAYLGWSF